MNEINLLKNVINQIGYLSKDIVIYGIILLTNLLERRPFMQYVAIKVRLIPTKEQEKLLWEHAGTKRYAYNFAKRCSEAFYQEKGKSIKIHEISRLFRQQYNNIPWIKDICKDVANEAIRDYGKARSKSFKQAKHGYQTRFKSKKDLEQGFAIDPRKIKIDGCVHLPKIGRIAVNQTPKRRSYKNTRVLFDGCYWYLSLVTEVPKEKVSLTNRVLGLDLGLKQLVVTSDGDCYENINRTKKVQMLEKKKKILSRQICKRYVKGAKRQSKNYLRSKACHLKVCRKLTNIRKNHLHQVSKALVKTKPKAIILEDLKVSNLLKNKRLSKAISQASWYTLRQFITYKAERFGIDVCIVPSSFPSSRLCSCCHERFNEKQQKRTWGLDIREWTCTHCGHTHDRDVNAALNLKWYYQKQG